MPRTRFTFSHPPNFSSSPSSSDDLIHTALRTHPTTLFLHGNGGTRVLPSRIQHYQAFAPGCRGYGDATSMPNEAWLTLDVRASWDWRRSHGAAQENVLVVGNSLGTAHTGSGVARKCP
jgi:abhydrolase domain-containing protein 12